MTSKEEQFKQKARQVHGDWYDYDHVEYKNNKTEVTIVCPEHGPFKQRPDRHLSGSGCKECGNTTSETKRKANEDSFIKRSRKLHNDFYGYDNVFYKNFHTKVEITCPVHGPFFQTPANHLSNHGCPGCSVDNRRMTQEEFIDRAIKTHGHFYDYRHAEYSTYHTPVKIVCPEHGAFWQTPAKHLGGFNCSQCAGNARATAEQFTEKAQKVHGNVYGYSKVEYVNRQTKVEIVCSKHGSFWQTPSDHLNGCGCPYCFTENLDGVYSMGWLESNPHLHDDPCLVYLLEVYNDSERFLKLGLTKNTVDKRYSHGYDIGHYSYCILDQKETTLKNGILLEEQAKDLFCFFKYYPISKFHGWTECFDMVVFENVKDLINNV